jgi:DNA invertase Pin-like site-specific DNA recombinase
VSKHTPHKKAHKKIGKNHPSLQQNTIGRADKSALVTKAVLAIRRGEFKDYSNTAKKFYCSHTAVMRRIKGQTKTR